MSQLKHIVKVGSVTAVSGNATLTIDAATRMALSGFRSAWVFINVTALAGSTAAGITYYPEAFLSDAWMKSDPGDLIQATGVYLIDGDESVAPLAMGTNMRFQFSVTGDPTAVGADVYMTGYKST